MAKAVAIAGKDLRVLWASPVPYIVGALLQLVLGLLYVDELEVRRQAVSQPLFPLAGFLLVLTVPVVAMRAIADEARTGSLDVLQAVPVRSAPLVIGKWLATWLTTLFVLAPALVLVLLVAWWGDPDLAPVLSGFTGLALLAAALAGVGVAASSLTSSQPVAAMVSMSIALVLWFAHVGTDRLGMSSLVRFSLRERLRPFAGGVIDTADGVFLIALCTGGLVVAAAVLDARRLQ